MKWAFARLLMGALYSEILVSKVRALDVFDAEADPMIQLYQQIDPSGKENSTRKKIKVVVNELEPTGRRKESPSPVVF